MSDEPDYRDIREIETVHWDVVRHAELDEVVEKEGHVKWRVKVRDEDRPAFITRFFNTPDAARGFITKVRNGG